MGFPGDEAGSRREGHPPMVTMGFLKSSSFHPMARRLARDVVILSTLPGSPGSLRGSPVSW